MVVFQCTDCLRYHDGARELLSWRWRAGCELPQLSACGKDDCAAVKDEAARIDMAKRAARKVKRQSKVVVDQASVRMPYKDADEREENHRSHKDQQQEFASSVEAVTQNEQVLKLLRVGFDEHDPTRESRGRWISNKEFCFTHRITNAHSRMSQLRGDAQTEQHELLRVWRLDIDSAVIDGAWSYSLCFKENSMRLAREETKETKESFLIY